MDCPIASDPTLTTAMFDHYEAVSSATVFEFTMRDNPALEVGDRAYLQLMNERRYGVWNYVLGDAACIVSDTQTLYSSKWSTLMSVVLTEIKRNFSGAFDADVTAITDIDASDIS
jgi:hypothetical protein